MSAVLTENQMMMEVVSLLDIPDFAEVTTPAPSRRASKKAARAVIATSVATPATVVPDVKPLGLDTYDWAAGEAEFTAADEVPAVESSEPKLEDSKDDTVAAPRSFADVVRVGEFTPRTTESAAPKVATSRNRVSRHESRLKRAGIRTAQAVGLIVVAATFGRLISVGEDALSSSGEDKAAAANIVNYPSASSEVTVPTQTVPVTTEAIQVRDAVVTTAAATTTEVATTVAPTTTEAPTTTTVAAKPLSLTERINQGLTTLELNRTAKIGTLVLDKFCEVVDVRVARPIDYTNPANFKYLSPEAQAKVAILAELDKVPKLTQAQQDQYRMLEDDIMTRGAINGTGDPMYYTGEPMLPAAENCVPQMADPRAEQNAYGDTDVTEMGLKGAHADQFQAIAAMLPEFAALPGGGKVTYIQGHRSSQSAAFNGLVDYVPGDTATYTGDDGKPLKYQMVRTEQIDAAIHLEDLVKKLNNEANGQDMLVLQACIKGDQNNRALYIFVAAKA